MLCMSAAAARLRLLEGTAQEEAVRALRCMRAGGIGSMPARAASMRTAAEPRPGGGASSTPPHPSLVGLPGRSVGARRRRPTHWVSKSAASQQPACGQEQPSRGPRAPPPAELT